MNKHQIEVRKREATAKRAKKEENKIYKIALDANIIIIIANFPSSLDISYKLKEQIKLFSEVLEEELQKKNKDFYFCFPERVMKEVISDKRIEKDAARISDFLRKKEISEFPLYKSKLDLYKEIFNLLRGRRDFLGNFAENTIFAKSEGSDCMILSECVAEKVDFLLTLNTNDFIGSCGEIRDQIKERLNSAKDYITKKYDYKNDFCEPITIPEFLEKFYPEKYEKYIKFEKEFDARNKELRMSKINLEAVYN